MNINLETLIFAFVIGLALYLLVNRVFMVEGMDPRSLELCPIEAGLLDETKSCSDLTLNPGSGGTATCSDFFEYDGVGRGWICGLGSKDGEKQKCKSQLDRRYECKPPRGDAHAAACNYVGYPSSAAGGCQCPGSSVDGTINPKGWAGGDDNVKYYTGSACELCDYKEDGTTKNCPCGDDSPDCGWVTFGDYKCSGETRTNDAQRKCVKK